ncbi:hypothetical protein MCEL_00040 [Mycolicibacterium celeriflavum]|uniref:Uncharacterized protein n=1 Tax=Mycolicibacterium celeriflavum TaxID=1249101 RepID=A0A7I7RCN5_MYCCF|nr:hypothetical protein MCEL_00040 [Mycolicibacterium celeriflavum]
MVRAVAGFPVVWMTSEARGFIAATNPSRRQICCTCSSVKTHTITTSASAASVTVPTGPRAEIAHRSALVVGPADGYDLMTGCDEAAHHRGAHPTRPDEPDACHRG